MVAALPALMSQVKCDWRGFSVGPGSRPEFQLGSRLIDANGHDSYFLFMVARWACIPFSWVGGYICFIWARKLYGEAAGLVATTLWCFSPNILGHASLITPDAPATALGVAACYTFWKWLKEPSWRLTYFSGVLLGVAELTKSTLIVLFPLWPILWLCYRWPVRASMRFHDWRREAAMLVARFLLAVLIINLGYGLEDSFTRLGEFEFVSRTLKGYTTSISGNRFQGSIASDFPVPLPKQYVLGIDIQRKVFEDHGKHSYLRGKWQKTGWWYYYLYGLAIKEPVGTIGLLLLATLGCFGNRLSGGPPQSEVISYSSECQPHEREDKRTLADEFVLLVPAVVILSFVSSQYGYSENIRYILPISPFLFIWCSRTFRNLGTCSVCWRSGQVWRKARKCFCNFLLQIVAAALLTCSVFSSLLAYPHSLSYFNEFVGGPRHGDDHLLGSNLDWGQDIRLLDWWMISHAEARPMFVDLVCLYDPKALGLDVKRVSETNLGASDLAKEPARLSPGWYAISVNRLRQSPEILSQSESGRVILLLSQLKPEATIGYTIYVYHV